MKAEQNLLHFSDIQLKRRLTPQQQLPAILAFARIANTLGRTFKLKKEQEFAIPTLVAAKVKFELLPALDDVCYLKPLNMVKRGWISSAS